MEMKYSYHKAYWKYKVRSNKAKHLQISTWENDIKQQKKVHVMAGTFNYVICHCVLNWQSLSNTLLNFFIQSSKMFFLWSSQHSVIWIVWSFIFYFFHWIIQHFLSPFRFGFFVAWLFIFISNLDVFDTISLG